MKTPYAKHVLIATWVFVVMANLASAASTVFICAPGVCNEGPSFTYEPLALERLGIQSSRYQQVYDASEFASILPGGGTIFELRFRIDGQAGAAFTAIIPDLQINLSITSRGPDQLSPVFAENIGANPVAVFGRGPGSLSGTSPGVGTAIPFDTPYFYDPSQGNLLLEILDYSRNGAAMGDPTEQVGALDYEVLNGDNVSRVYAHDVNATMGTVDTGGLITFFLVTPVPEPATIWLWGLGAGVFGLLMLKRKRSKTMEGNAKCHCSTRCS